MLIISNIILKKDYTETQAKKAIAMTLKCKDSVIKNFHLYKKSIDARKGSLKYVYSFAVDLENESKFVGMKGVSKAVDACHEVLKPKKSSKIVIVGFGPAGFMCALTLARSGLKPIVIERGSAVDKRLRDVEEFSSNMNLNPNSNIQFGEGGAGTFSDGKLTTGINDPLNRFVLSEFVRFGAPNEIEYQSKPHIGTDYLMNMVKNIRQEVISLGGEIHFDTRLTDITISDGHIRSIKVEGAYNEEFKCDSLVLAIGHSSRDTFELLKSKGISMIQKPFSIGARIEHLQENINISQYRSRGLTADYKLSTHTRDGRGVYTFCMCPGGVVVPASSEVDCVVTNGMSYYKRDGVNANSALLVGVSSKDFGSEDVLAGVEFQRVFERLAYKVSNSYTAPVQKVGDFVNGIETKSLGEVRPTYPNFVLADLRSCLPPFVLESMKYALPIFDSKLKGFGYDDAILTGVETRTSSPVRILRNDGYASLSADGLYPCGEGAGYAGGIMSAAVDGIKVADAIISKLI